MGNLYAELFQLCTFWHTVPVSYELKGVVKQGDSFLRISGMTEIWEGTYHGEVVALKVLQLPQNNDGVGERKDFNSNEDNSRTTKNKRVSVWHNFR
jgi:hypothetical protein